VTFSAACPNPMHRLFAIVGEDRINHEMATTDWPNLLSAVAISSSRSTAPNSGSRPSRLCLRPRPARPPTPLPRRAASTPSSSGSR
jgi:hypothetical protein